VDAREAESQCSRRGSEAASDKGGCGVRRGDEAGGREERRNGLHTGAGGKSTEEVSTLVSREEACTAMGSRCRWGRKQGCSRTVVEVGERRHVYAVRGAGGAAVGEVGAHPSGGTDAREDGSTKGVAGGLGGGGRIRASRACSM
jgi:hypothetical protein